jgi:hypothetical protein
MTLIAIQSQQGQIFAFIRNDDENGRALCPTVARQGDASWFVRANAGEELLDGSKRHGS